MKAQDISVGATIYAVWKHQHTYEKLPHRIEVRRISILPNGSFIIWVPIRVPGLEEGYESSRFEFFRSYWDAWAYYVRQRHKKI